MSRRALPLVAVMVTTIGISALTAVAAPSSSASPLPGAAISVDPVDPKEPPGRPDDPPRVPAPPDVPSTVLEDLRASTAVPPSEQSRARSFAVPSDNRIVGSLIAAGGQDVVAQQALDTVGYVTDRSTTRSAGADRYATAVALSSDHFPDGATDVWISTGENFPDGLTASSVAGARPGPVLLTPASELPPTVRAELQRLAPRHIWVVGGPSAVSEGVVQTVEAAAPDAAVERLGDIDRYGTAAALAAQFFDTAPAVFIATGRDFPDALSAGPAAAGEDAPTLLVTRDHVPTATETQLRRLRPSVVFIVGGPAVVSPEVAARIGAITGARVERVAGPDRYGTAAAVSDRFFGATAPSMMLATARNFPDSIAAGAVAGAADSPLLLVDGDDTPPRVTIDAARRLSWWLPASGRVLRYTVIAHPDDEFAAWSIIGAADPRRFDVMIVLTTGESTGYCTGEPVSNEWSALQFLPQPQPTGQQYSDRCRKHRMDSWHEFAERSGIGPFSTADLLTGGPVDVDGRQIPVPLRRDEAGAVVEAGDYSLELGQDAAVVSFDMGALTSDEVLWAVQTTRGLVDRFPTQLEGDVIGAGFYNDAASGYDYRHPDHRAVYEALGGTDLGLPGSQYATVGHAQSNRVFGAMVDGYCDAMCHPGAPAAFRGEMGRFQYAYGWLASGYWRPGAVDAHAGFSEYQSFTKAF